MLRSMSCALRRSPCPSRSTAKLKARDTPLGLYSTLCLCSADSATSGAAPGGSRLCNSGIRPIFSSLSALAQLPARSSSTAQLLHRAVGGAALCRSTPRAALR